MVDGDILVLNGDEVARLLAGQELEIIRTVRSAYEIRAAGDSSLPHSTFLRFPHEPRNRIIALPAYLGSEYEVAGIKWVASFPNNIEHGMDRASATVILNSALTGRPKAIVEASIISAKRTAASAALAARTLHQGESIKSVGMIGCGLINFEIARFLLSIFPDLKRLIIFDLSEARACRFQDRCRQSFAGVEVVLMSDTLSVLESSALISLATTAIEPHIFDLSACPAASTLLHISLRDIAPEALLACDNVVDDIDHVCRAQTSVHLAEQRVGHRDFIRCTLADILNGSAAARKDKDLITIFSPFGLGILDLAVGQRVYELGLKLGLGTVIKSFLPGSWSEPEQPTLA